MAELFGGLVRQLEFPNPWKIDRTAEWDDCTSPDNVANHKKAPSNSRSVLESGSLKIDLDKMPAKTKLEA